MTDPEYCQWTHDQIARHVGITRRTVLRVAELLKEIPETPEEDSGDDSTDNVTLSHYQTPPVGNEGEKPASQPKNEAPEKPQFPTDSVGKRIPRHLIVLQ